MLNVTPPPSTPSIILHRKNKPPTNLRSQSVSMKRERAEYTRGPTEASATWHLSKDRKAATGANLQHLRPIYLSSMIYLFIHFISHFTSIICMAKGKISTYSFFQGQHISTPSLYLLSLLLCLSVFFSLSSLSSFFSFSLYIFSSLVFIDSFSHPPSSYSFVSLPSPFSLLISDSLFIFIQRFLSLGLYVCSVSFL